MRTKPQIQYIADFKLCSKDHFLILKGISILMVVLVHICVRYLNIDGVQPLQGIAAAVFLLCSGYGVSESFKDKNGLTHYWENKALKVWLPSLFAMVGCSLIMRGGPLAWVAESPVALHGWFLYLLFGEYLAFWLAFYFFESKNTRNTILMAVSVVGFFVIDRQEVAVQMLCFPLGVMFSQYGLRHRIKKQKVLGKATLCCVAASIAVGAWILAPTLSQPYLYNLCGMILALGGAVFLCFGVYFVQKVGIFGIFAPFGSVAYGIYLLHEQILILLQKYKTTKLAIAIIVAMFIISAIFSWLCKLLVDSNKKLRRRKKTRLKGSMW